MIAQHQIIQFLREAKGYISGEEMSRQLKMSRAAIWKHMHQLRELGYEIEAVPHLGYRLSALPDKLLVDEIQQGLTTTIFGRSCYSYESIDSTMDEAFRLSVNGVKHGALICAETQTKGRGRMGRSWISPNGKGLYLSLVLRPNLSLNQMPQLTLMTAVAILEAINKLPGINAKVKWPNDLLIDGKKVAGILTEMRAESDQIKFVVIGIGLNVNATASGLIETATSLKMASGKNIERIKLLQDLLLSLEKWYERVEEGQFNKVLEVWKKFSDTLGKRVRLIDGKNVVEGVATGLDDSGALLVKQDGGKVIKKYSGDVSVVK